MKHRIGVLCIKLSNKHEFREKLLSDIQLLFPQGLKLISTNFTDSVKILCRKCTQNLLSDLEFREKQLSDIHSLFTQGLKLISSDFTNSFNILCRKCTQNLPSDLEFREKRCQ
jgi:hypothetical protein